MDKSKGELQQELEKMSNDFSMSIINLNKKNSVANSDVKNELIALKNRVHIQIADVSKIVEALLPDEPDSIFNMKEGQMYWYIDSDGFVCYSDWGLHPINGKRRSIGNIYLTEAAAEFEVEKLKLTQEIAAWQFEHDKFVPDWEDDTQAKYFIEYSYYTHTVIADFSAKYQLNQDCESFSSQKKAEQCVQSIGSERIKKYLFGVVL